MAEVLDTIMIASDSISSVVPVVTTDSIASSLTVATDTIGELIFSLDTVWVLLASALVFFMQAGFALVEAGFTRSKNTVNILMKNLIDFAFGSLAFFLIGFGIMFGNDDVWRPL